MEVLLTLLLAVTCLATGLFVLLAPPWTMERQHRWSAIALLLWVVGLVLVAGWVQSLNAAGERSDQEGNLLLLFTTTYWLAAAACAAATAVATTYRPPVRSSGG